MNTKNSNKKKKPKKTNLDSLEYRVLKGITIWGILKVGREVPRCKVNGGKRDW